MTDIERIVRAVLEAVDDDFDAGDEPVKDILNVAPPKGSKEGYIERHGRWANVTIGDDNWCISYLTPVAVFIHGEGPYISDRHWSSSTSNHIRMWANEIGWGSGMRYAEIEKRAKRMPQQELIDRFKEAQGLVKWTNRQSDRLRSLPANTGHLKSDSKYRVELEPDEGD